MRALRGAHANLLFTFSKGGRWAADEPDVSGGVSGTSGDTRQRLVAISAETPFFAATKVFRQILPRRPLGHVLTFALAAHMRKTAE